MGHHENWLASASRNVLVAKNNYRKRRATFGDDPSESGGIGTFTNPENNSATAPIDSGSTGSPTFENTGGQPTLSNNPIAQSAVPENMSGVGTIQPKSGGGATDPGFAVTLGQNTSPTATNDPATLQTAVVDAGAQAMSAAGQSASAYTQGASLASQGVSGPALGAALAAQPPTGQTAFNGGVALANGASKVVPPPGVSPGAAAGFLTAHGLVGAPSAVQGAVAGSLAQTPAVRSGLVAGIASVKKSWWRKLLDWLHL